MAMIAKPSRFDAERVPGRPDLNNQDFGVTEAKTFPPFIFSVNKNAGLVHKVAHVSLHWYRVAEGGGALIRMTRPIMFARTVCNQGWRLQGEDCRTCVVPSPDAILCGRCHGEGATFGKRGKHRGMPRQIAHVKLGCTVKAY